MCIRDYIGVILTIVFVVSFVGCVKYFGEWYQFGAFWFYAGALILSGAVLTTKIAEA